MKGIYIPISICLIFISYSALAQKEYSFKLDIPINSAGLNDYEYIGENGIFTGPSSHVEGRAYKIGEAKVIVGMDRFSNIVYYLCCDPNFLINKNKYLKLERKYLDSLKSKSTIVFEPDIAYIPIENGWYLAFHYKDIRRSKEKGYFLKKGAKPTCVFKRSNKVDESLKLKSKVAGAQVIN
jgi:hypothetical protein